MTCLESLFIRNQFVILWKVFLWRYRWKLLFVHLLLFSKYSKNSFASVPRLLKLDQERLAIFKRNVCITNLCINIHLFKSAGWNMMPTTDETPLRCISNDVQTSATHSKSIIVLTERCWDCFIFLIAPQTTPALSSSSSSWWSLSLSVISRFARYVFCLQKTTNAWFRPRFRSI